MTLRVVGARRPNTRLQRTRFALLRSPLSRKPLGRLKLLPVMVAVASLVGCGSRLSERHASQLVRRSPAFVRASSTRTGPVFARVSALLASVADWKPQTRDSKQVISSQERPQMFTAAVVASRESGSWQIDERRTKAFIPSWPDLPRDAVHAVWN